jgi:predicted nucleic acid-binding protein
VILAHTSVWIDHFRLGNADLFNQLSKDNIVTHPFIIAELAMGSLADRARTLGFLDRLPQVRRAQLAEVRRMIETSHLYGQGIGLIDAHLIASVLLSSHVLLWTMDKRLRDVAESLGIHAMLP